jgi:hypothetical protein
MFGWLKRKSRDNELLAQLASASAKRRADQNRTCEDDMGILLNHALKLATFFLEGGQVLVLLPVRDGFPPFGSGIWRSGHIVDFVCHPSPGSPGSFDVSCVQLADAIHMVSHVKEDLWPDYQREEPPPIETVGKGMRQCAGGGSIHATALVDRVDHQPPHCGEPASAIRVQIEHVEAAPATSYLSYRIRDQKLIRMELWKATGQPVVFASQPSCKR